MRLELTEVGARGLGPECDVVVGTNMHALHAKRALRIAVHGGRELKPGAGLIAVLFRARLNASIRIFHTDAHGSRHGIKPENAPHRAEVAAEGAFLEEYAQRDRS